MLCKNDKNVVFVVNILSRFQTTSKPM